MLHIDPRVDVPQTASQIRKAVIGIEDETEATGSLEMVQCVGIGTEGCQPLAPWYILIAAYGDKESK